MLDTNTNPFAERGRALEEEYFRRVDRELLRKRREELEREQMIAELNNITGVHDNELSKHLIEVGIDSTTVAALSLTPLAFVAWADGSISTNERQTVISTAIRQGVYDCPDAFNLVEQWLRTRPRKPLWEAWKHYAVDFHNSMPAVIANKLAQRTLIRCARVAKASGGVMGFGKISSAEQRVLDEIRIVLPLREESIA